MAKEITRQFEVKNSEGETYIITLTFEDRFETYDLTEYDFPGRQREFPWYPYRYCVYEYTYYTDHPELSYFSGEKEYINVDNPEKLLKDLEDEYIRRHEEYLDSIKRGPVWAK